MGRKTNGREDGEVITHLIRDVLAAGNEASWCQYCFQRSPNQSGNTSWYWAS